MILITGGLGFIGLNTARALLALGETCVLTQHQSAHLPEDLKDEMGSRLFIEPLDVMDVNALLAVGEKYRSTMLPVDDRRRIRTLSMPSKRTFLISRLSCRLDTLGSTPALFLIRTSPGSRRTPATNRNTRRSKPSPIISAGSALDTSTRQLRGPHRHEPLRSQLVTVISALM